MNGQNSRQLKQRAADALSRSFTDPRKLFFLHISVSMAASVLLAVLGYFLNLGIAQTGGISGIATRSALKTAQTILEGVVSFALPFWQMGLMFAALRLSRQEQAPTGCLLEGFRQLGPVFRLNLLKSLLLCGIVFASFYAGLLISTFTPLSLGFQKLMTPILENSTEAELLLLLEDPAFTDQMITALLPVLLAALAVSAAVSIPVIFRLRMAEFSLMDNPAAGARSAIKASWQMTKGNCLALLRLDLSFWWFYLLDLLLVGIFFLDQLLPVMNVTLPVSGEVAYLLCTALYALGQILLYGLANPQVLTTYACAYDALKPEPQPQAPIIIE